LNEATGAFTVYAKEGNVLVFHRCMGRYAVPMKRRAVIAFLTLPPAHLYVMCSMVE